jgi:hypothetical protein
MVNVPAGIHTYCAPSLEFSLTSPAFGWPATEVTMAKAQVIAMGPLRSINAIQSNKNVPHQTAVAYNF